MLHTPNELYTCYIVWLALVSICEIDVTSFSEDGRGVNGYVTNPNPTPTLTLTATLTLTLTLFTKLMKKSRKKQL